MSAAAPWSVKGIEPKAREIAKDLARRSGMTLGEWLNTMILEDDDDGVVPLSRREHAAESIDRRGRYRRVDDAYSTPDAPWDRLSASVDAIAARLEASERRSTVAIQGVDQAVTGLVRRLENQDQKTDASGRRIDDIAEELREGHKRLRRFEQEVGPRTVETFGKVETTLGSLAGRLYDIEERQRSGVNELRQRMDAVEKVAGPGAGTDMMAAVAARLDAAQATTGEALRGLERAFAGLDQRLRAAEARGGPEASQEAARFEKLAETLSRQVETNRTEMMRRLDTAETENRMARIEQTVLSIGEQARTAEQRSAQAVEAMGREVLRIAQNLNGRVAAIETDVPARLDRLGATLSQKVEQDIGRYTQAVDHKLVAAEDRHVLALEKLGGEITRISDRLSDRIAQSERRSSQALDDIAKRLTDSTATVEQRFERTSGELAERVRLSEQRTAQLLADARESLEQRSAAAAVTAGKATVVRPDWRATAFQDDDFSNSFEDDAAWTDVAITGESDPAPFPAPFMEAAAPEPAALVEPAPTAAAIAAEVVREAVLRAPEPEPVVIADPEPVNVPFGRPSAATSPMAGFGGADVSDALEATAAVAPTVPDAETDDFAAETDFVDPRALRAAAAAGRASTTRQAIEAARAAMAPAEVEAPARSGFGLKRGGKSRLQERLDKQAARDGGTVRKALGASAAAVCLVVGGTYAYDQLTGEGGLPQFSLGGFGGGFGAGANAAAGPMLALATSPTTGLPPAPAGPVSEGETLYTSAIEQLDAGDVLGIETLTRAASLGYAPAQLHLAGLYQTGDHGVAVNLAESRLWARRAAEGSDPRGMHAYGMYLFDGVGGPRNRAEALDWLLKAARGGLVDSQYNVARIYENGDEGVAANIGEAYKWYMVAAHAGDDDARAAADRLGPSVPASARRVARAAAETFEAAPLA
ncbi:MAG: localization factor PodJL [Brevundimonas sp.]|uniref:SEL1-like repeat protein n=1 Tax=Brevundimonas sp. TaxID=1871086 RepID=UPI0039E2E4EA